MRNYNFYCSTFLSESVVEASGHKSLQIITSHLSAVTKVSPIMKTTVTVGVSFRKMDKGGKGGRMAVLPVGGSGGIVEPLRSFLVHFSDH